jgi:hypothetical protein
MRHFLASAVTAACVAAIALPLTLPAQAVLAVHPPVDAPEDLAGTTRTLPLVPLAGSDRALGARAAEGLPARTVKPFSLLGVTWDNAATDLHGAVQVRTRATGTRVWSPWQDVEAHNDDVPDLGDTTDRAGGRSRGATMPLWVGDSDGVQVRIRPERRAAAAPALPPGLRLDMVDPGDDPPQPNADLGLLDMPELAGLDGGPLPYDVSGGEPASDSALPGGPGAIPALSRKQTEAEAPGKRYLAARPRIITRAGWGADERLRRGKYIYTKKVKAVFVHHSATGNNYTCAEAPSIIRSIYRYHVRSSGWRDIGYNFLVDKCGNVYEGRAGGVTKAVYGAHTLGFNSNSMGIAVLGTYSHSDPPAAALDAVSQLAAWKLGLFGANPDGSTWLVSGGSNKFKKGTRVKLRVISGHRDGFATECPGSRLYHRLGNVRDTAAGLQGR